jgi:hypothetical protein
MTQEMADAVDTIREFLDGSGNMWAWDDFLSVPPKDPRVTVLQGFCRQLRADYPPLNRQDYCSDAGKDRLRAFLADQMGTTSSQVNEKGR